MEKIKVFGLLLILLVFSLISCDTDSTENDGTVYNITIGTLEDGTITADPTSGIEGTEITLSVTPNIGYKLKVGTLKYDTTVINETTKKFNLPASNVTITAEFELITSDSNENKSIKLTNIESKYTIFYFTGLKNNVNDENIIYGNPYNDIQINNGTASMDIYNLGIDGLITENWNGSGSYFVLLGLFDGENVDVYISKNKIPFTNKITEISFINNFNYID